MEKTKQRIGLIALLFVLVFCGTLSVSAAVISPREISATATTATVNWTPVTGASFYLISYGKRGTDENTYRDIKVTTNSYTFTGLMQDVVYNYCVVAYDLTGKAISTIPSNYNPLYALPVSIKDFTCYGWNKTGGYFRVSDRPKIIDGVEWQIWNSKGTRQIASGRSTFANFTANIKRNQTYILKVRSYFTSPYSETLYSSWSSKVIVPEPEQKKPTLASAGGRDALKLRWTKVKGATKYLIYASTSGSSGYRKVAAAGKNKSSYIFSKYRKKPLQKYKTYYFKVYAVKGSVKSTANSYSYAYIYIRR